MPFKILPELFGKSGKSGQDADQWLNLTPRTLFFAHFFSLMQADWSPTQYVEALSSAGVNLFLLETFPEAVLAPLREAIVHCQTEPPTWWSKTLLEIIGREDVNLLLSPGQRPRQAHATLLVGRNPAFFFHCHKAKEFRHLRMSLVWMFMLSVFSQQR